jgi:beta-glucanase (GH16 family)
MAAETFSRHRPPPTDWFNQSSARASGTAPPTSFLRQPSSASPSSLFSPSPTDAQSDFGSEAARREDSRAPLHNPCGIAWLGDGEKITHSQWEASKDKNGDAVFNVGWEANHVRWKPYGNLTLSMNDHGHGGQCPGVEVPIEPKDCATSGVQCCGQPYASGEVFTNDYSPGALHPSGWYEYGCFSVEMQAAAGDGILTTFFLANYRNADFATPQEGDALDDYGNGTRNEIDVEVFGMCRDRSGPCQPAYAQYGVFNNSSYPMVDPTLRMRTDDDDDLRHVMVDPSVGFHQYDILWAPKHVEVWVDGYPRAHWTVDLPRKFMRLFANLWNVKPGHENWDDDVHTGTPRVFRDGIETVSAHSTFASGGVTAHFRRFRYYSPLTAIARLRPDFDVAGI